MQTIESISMKGQDRAASQAQVWLNGITEGKPVKPCLISAPSGTGKSHLLELMAPQLEEKGFQVVRFPTFSETMRGQAECKKKILPYLCEGGKYAIFADEFHRVKGGGGLSSACAMAWETALLPMGGATLPNYTHFPLYIGEETLVDWRNVALIGATNLPGELETLANRRVKETPYRRRFYNVELSKYSRDVIGDVIGDFLFNKGLKASECATGTIGRFHRGTMEAIDQVITQFTLVFPGAKTVTREKLLEAAKMTTWFPRGITRQEARLMAKLVDSGGRLNAKVAAPILDVTASEVTSAGAHLYDQYTEAGEHVPFIDFVGSSSLIITEAGRKYVAAVVKEGFTL